MTPQNDVDLTAIMLRDDIENIHSYPCVQRFSVTLRSGAFGVGETVGAALEVAQSPGAENIKQVAA